MEITYEALGWIAFLCWSLCFYPQVILNFRRKSVVGLNFDFIVLNLTKHTSYLIYNATLYFSSTVQNQYFQKYGFGQMIPVAANDVALSIHVTLLTIILLFQISIYERGDQTISKIALLIVSVVWLFAGVCFFIALQTQSWLWLISIFKFLGKLHWKYREKILLSLISMFFDLVFICQRFLIYSTGKVKLPSETSIGKQPLIISDHTEADNV
ncbi:hypothetical protein CsatB_021345 [Cannabis sativa]